MPPEQIVEGQAAQVTRTLQRSCDHRTSCNRRERRAVRFDGVSALRVGVPLAAIGLVVMALAAQIEPVERIKRIVSDHFGFVLAWLGLWFPLDQFFFYPLTYGRENWVLAVLRDAEVAIAPHEVSVLAPG